jgi:hypothetical protein
MQALSLGEKTLFPKSCERRIRPPHQEILMLGVQRSDSQYSSQYSSMLQRAPNAD